MKLKIGEVDMSKLRHWGAPRRLSVFDFNDRPDVGFDRACGKYLAVQVIDTWSRAQEILISPQGGSGSKGRSAKTAFDIGLIDVSYDDDPDLKGQPWRWASCRDGTRLIPAGPILALPFIAGRAVRVMIPYSAHWAEVSPGARPTRQPDGILCVALGLLIASVQGKVVEGRDLFSEKGIGGFLTDANPRTALKRAFPLYRQKLEDETKAERIVLAPACNEWCRCLNEILHSTSDAFVPLSKKAKADGLAIEDAAITLWSEWGRDSILLTSIFADELGFPANAEAKVKRAAIEKMVNWVDGLCESAGQKTELYKTAARVMEDLEDGLQVSDENVAPKKPSGTKKRLPLHSIFEKYTEDMSIEDKNAVLTLVVHLAHAHEWDTQPAPRQLGGVPAILCLGDKNVRSYLDLFGLRRKSKRRPTAHKFYPENSFYPTENTRLNLFEKACVEWYLCDLHNENHLAQEGLPPWAR